MKVIECETTCVGVVPDIKHAVNMKCWCYIGIIDGTNKTFNTKR